MPVSTPSGDVPISALEVGDLVLAYHEATGTTGTYTVTATWQHLDPFITTLTIAGEEIEATPEHPFFVLLRGWVEAGDLRVGDSVRLRDGSYALVEATETRYDPQVMYNVTVAEAHTYFVGDDGCTVHNACKRPGGYRVYDVDRHGNLSPQKNRAPGHTNTAADNLVQSHHPIQDQWAKTNVPGYKRNDAPAVLLPSSSGQSHAHISAAQSVAANARTQSGLPRWTSTTIRQEFNSGYRGMIDAGVPRDVARRAIRNAYKYFDMLGAFPCR